MKIATYLNDCFIVWTFMHILHDLEATLAYMPYGIQLQYAIGKNSICVEVVYTFLSITSAKFQKQFPGHLCDIIRNACLFGEVIKISPYLIYFCFA